MNDWKDWYSPDPAEEALREYQEEQMARERQEREIRKEDYE